MFLMTPGQRERKGWFPSFNILSCEPWHNNAYRKKEYEYENEFNENENGSDVKGLFQVCKLIKLFVLNFYIIFIPNVFFANYL